MTIIFVKIYLWFHEHKAIESVEPTKPEMVSIKERRSSRCTIKCTIKSHFKNNEMLGISEFSHNFVIINMNIFALLINFFTRINSYGWT